MFRVFMSGLTALGGAASILILFIPAKVTIIIIIIII